MPTCTVCGYAVEWLRSCYVSKWRLFKNHPEIHSLGRYCFAPDSTPHYPGQHYLGSRIWTTDDDQDPDALGELRSEQQAYSAGFPLSPLPPAGLIGDEACIREGEQWPLPLVVREIVGGFDSRCFALVPEIVPDPPFTLDVRDCHTQRRFALVLSQQYQGDSTTAEATLQGHFPTATISRVPNSGSVFPGTLIATLGTTSIVVISGTTTPWQWVTQSFWSVVGQISYGAYSTMTLWQQAADRILARMTAAGCDANGPVVLVGHSYGAAVACILAARFRLHNFNRTIGLLTEGCPKPGDQRLVDILDAVTQVHLINDDDPVTFLPPGGPELGALQAVVPGTLWNRWSIWERPRNRVGLRENGTRIDNPPADGLYALLFRMTLQAVAGETPTAVSAHNSYEYYSRIICPNAPAPSPVPDPSWVLWVRPESLDGSTPGGAVAEWPDESGSENSPQDGGLPAAAFYLGPTGSAQPGILCTRSVSLFTPTTLFMTTDHTFFLVGGRYVSVGTSGPQIRRDTLNDFTHMRQSLTTVTYRVPTGIVNVADALADDAPHVYSFRRQEGRLVITKDGTTLSDTSFSSTDQFLGFALGAVTATPSEFRTAFISEVLAYAGVMSDAQHDETLYYLLVKYGYAP